MEDEKLISVIIDRYGEIINLRETPYVMLEIIRTHFSDVSEPDGGLPPGGVGPVGPKNFGDGFSDGIVDNLAIMQEILKLSKQVFFLTEEIRSLKQ
jgi:hypothetical protein